MKVLANKQGYQLLLLRVKSEDSNETRPFIVGLCEQKAKKLLQKVELTVLDFERDEIVCFFQKEEEVTYEVIQSSIEYFNKHFVKNEKMKSSFKI